MQILDSALPLFDTTLPETVTPELVVGAAAKALCDDSAPKYSIGAIDDIIINMTKRKYFTLFTLSPFKDNSL